MVARCDSNQKNQMEQTTVKNVDDVCEFCHASCSVFANFGLYSCL
jgi:predicted molibdopterin-dependent oxidoreductase YjgC